MRTTGATRYQWLNVFFAGLVGCILTGKGNSYVHHPWKWRLPIIPIFYCAKLFRPQGPIRVHLGGRACIWSVALSAQGPHLLPTDLNLYRPSFMNELYSPCKPKTDTAIFIATLTRTLTIYRRNRTGAAVPLIKVMMRDGECLARRAEQ